MCCPPKKAGGHESLCASRLEALFCSEATPPHRFRRFGPEPRAAGLIPFFFFFFFFTLLYPVIFSRFGIYWATGLSIVAVWRHSKH